MNVISGMLINLDEGSAEMVVGSFALNIIRQPYVDWLAPVAKFVPNIYIKQDDTHSDLIDWDLLKRPFSNHLWAAIFLVAFGWATVIFFINFLFARITVREKVQFAVGPLYGFKG